MSVVGSSVLGMAQRFEHEGSPGGPATPEETLVCPADVPVLNLCAPAGDPVALIDLGALAHTAGERALAELISTSHAANARSPAVWARDRKSTRLNSSHVASSYAVFCLKKKNE